MRKWPYGSPAWAPTRKAILARDKYQCQIRLPGCLGRANAADHIMPVSAGGAPFDHDNLRAACIHCNSARQKRGRDLDPVPLPPSREW